MSKANMSTLQGPKPMNVWWPLGFLMAWIVFAVVGGGLLGGGIANATNSGCSFGNGETTCLESTGSNSLLIGAIICLVISGLLGLAFWVVFIIWLVKRTRARSYTIHLPSEGYSTPDHNAQAYPALPQYPPQQQPPPQPQQPPMAREYNAPPQFAPPKQEPVEAPANSSSVYAEASQENYR